ncbi:MAG: hypothetical protein GX495_12295 [Chloroflexi bacterium]|jgi:hypothetical protein|nr:hypothetical protein [Chloroflexota bacterium]
MQEVSTRQQVLPLHGWIGLGLIAVFWTLNWTLTGLRTHWGFFPLWLGYCLLVDSLVYVRRGTSLLTRSWKQYIGLFLVSVPVWWLFEGLNWRLQNWTYVGAEAFSPFTFWLWATLNFSTVVPAVFGTAELIGSFDFVRKLGRGPVIRPDRRVTSAFFIAGVLMLVMMWIWPQLFFPFAWISIYFICEPLNVWLKNRSLADDLAHGDWRRVIALWLGVLLTGFFWEMWNYFSYPKWVYSIPWADCCHVFEMPALGYGGYLPFALELYALYHLAIGFVKGNKDRQPEYVQIIPGA